MSLHSCIFVVSVTVKYKNGKVIQKKCYNIQEAAGHSSRFEEQH